MADQLAQIAAGYTGFAMTSDGAPEIASLTYMPFEAGYPEPPADGRLVVVLVEPRLLGRTPVDALQTTLLDRLRRFKGDLRAEGLHSRFVLADVYRGPIHKDGRTVLALRRFLIDVRAAFPRLEGVILVGNFPESTIVRRVAWSPEIPPRLFITPEVISSRADIVLGHLTGQWEALYRQDAFRVESIIATPDAATSAAGWCDEERIRNGDFSSTAFTVGPSRAFQDACYIDDAIYTIQQNDTSPPRLRVRLSQAERNPELAPDDLAAPNPIARPDIAISRLNAFHIAMNPDPAFVGTDGKGFLDAAGKPQTVTSPSQTYALDQRNRLFAFPDMDLERRLLIDYFDRNHRFRVGAFAKLPFRAAVVSGTVDFDPSRYVPLVNAAATDFGTCVSQGDADLLEYVAALRTPAVLKYVMAHSDATSSAFPSPPTPAVSGAALAAAVGGQPALWNYAAGRYVPGFPATVGRAELALHRALWMWGSLEAAGASIVIHGGCDVNTVQESQTQTYTDKRYGRWSNAEGFLFFTNCVALYSRAKGFNDAPGGFGEGFRTSVTANLSDCVKAYVGAQAGRGDLLTYNIQRKRSYFWSISGDWTTRLRNRNGLGVIGLDAAGLRSIAVHPNWAWVDGWNFEAGPNRIAGVGDLDGDGVDEMVVQSAWGIGVLKYDGTHFRALMLAPRNTWFGGWRYDATSNTGRDNIQEVANFTGTTSRREVMVWSSWGITTLELSGASFTPTRIHQNGTRFGGWLLNTADNKYCGSGQFDSDFRNDMIVMSPWGLGIISIERGTPVMMAPNGTRFGGWLLSTADNRVRLVGDFDGDGWDEILITSAWGMGILKKVGDSLVSLAMQPNGASIGGHVVGPRTSYDLADGLQGDIRFQIVVTDTSGIHVLALQDRALVRLAFAANGSRVDGWLVETNVNRVDRAGDLNGDGRAEWIIRSPWGMGVMGLDESNRIRVLTMAPNDSVLGDWRLQQHDDYAASGNLAGSRDRRELVLLKP